VGAGGAIKESSSKIPIAATSQPDREIRATFRSDAINWAAATSAPSRIVAAMSAGHPAVASAAPLAAAVVAMPQVAAVTASPPGNLAGFLNPLRIPSSPWGSDVPGIPGQLATGALALVRREIENLLIDPGPTTTSARTTTAAAATRVRLPALSIANASVVEGSSGTANMAFTVTLSKASTTSVSVGYATSSGTATAGSDYSAGSGTITFAPGEKAKSVTVGVVGDTTVEADETFTVKLSAPSGATISRATATGTIRNDDAAPVLPSLSIADASNTEGGSGAANMAFTVTLSKALTTPVTVGYATSNATATAGSDYTATTGTVTFAAGETAKTVNVAVIGDTTAEPIETFMVTLSAPSGATLTRATATGTIVDDDTVAGSAVPFGSHLRPYAPGTLALTGSRATIDAAVVSLYNKWKTNFLVSAGSYGLAVKASADYPYVSEGQGYGMELTVVMAGADPSAQSSFDGILKYVLAHPSSINPNLHASEQNASFASVNGRDSATDGDLSIAYALLQADRQWGSAGTYNYKQLAVTRINAIKASEMNPTTYLPTLGDWVTAGDAYYKATRPSDLMIDHFRAFKAATSDPFWDLAVTAAQNLIAQQQNTYAPSTGLIADFVVNTTTTPAPAPANFLEGSTDGQYAYNSVRVPWHLGVDAAVFGDAVSKAEAQKITTWFRAKTGDDPSKVVSGYKLDGTPVVTYLDPEFVATLGPAAMGNSANQAWLDKIWSYTVAQSQTSAANSYYSSSLLLQSMIVMSGNYWTP
jgi:endo-1,4-beta-D-glucanase Y